MADSAIKESTTWPMPKFRFEVDFGPLKGLAFQEVSGMDEEVQVIDYRHSNSEHFSSRKMPGVAKYGNVTLKRGVFVNDNSFWDWMNAIKMNTVQRCSVLIKLLDETGAVMMQWQLPNAWPTKITASDLTSDGKEVAVESIELAHEQLIVTHGG